MESLVDAKKLPDMPTYYVFDDGRVYSTTTRMFIKPYVNGGKPNQRYLVVRLQENGVKKTFRVHRLVALLFLPNPDDLPQVNHKDGNKLNPQLANLEWCSQADNAHHAYAQGLQSQKGVMNGNARLTESDVLSIRNSTTSSRILAKMFGVTSEHIQAIKKGLRWQI